MAGEGAAFEDKLIHIHARLHKVRRKTTENSGQLGRHISFESRNISAAGEAGDRKDCTGKNSK